jgi:hypothetical protein
MNLRHFHKSSISISCSMKSVYREINVERLTTFVYMPNSNIFLSALSKRSFLFESIHNFVWCMMLHFLIFLKVEHFLFLSNFNHLTVASLEARSNLWNNRDTTDQNKFKISSWVWLELSAEVDVRGWPRDWCCSPTDQCRSSSGLNT